MQTQRALCEQEYVRTIRLMSEKVTTRMWIASPFIGDLYSVRRILGTHWEGAPGVNVKLLTEKTFINRLNYETILEFRKCGAVKHLSGLHAKIFIFDDVVILGSANLTKTAFAKRHEAGMLLVGTYATEVLKIYEDWWSTIAEDVEIDETIAARKPDRREAEEIQGELLSNLWDLPPAPAPHSKANQAFSDYQKFIHYYQELAAIYETLMKSRIWPQSPLFFEIDGLLNYLFHDNKNKPSRKYVHESPRKLNDSQRRIEILKYVGKFKKYIKETNEIANPRDRSSALIRELLDPNKIDKLAYEDVLRVVDQLNSLSSVKIARARFLNRNNNSVEIIKKSWKNLLHGSGKIQERMLECKNSLYSFGNSSIQELIGWYEPNLYPLRNRNANAGLRFFGYDVNVY